MSQTTFQLLQDIILVKFTLISIIMTRKYSKNKPYYILKRKNIAKNLWYHSYPHVTQSMSFIYTHTKINKWTFAFIRKGKNIPSTICETDNYYYIVRSTKLRLSLVLVWLWRNSNEFHLNTLAAIDHFSLFPVRPQNWSLYIIFSFKPTISFFTPFKVRRSNTTVVLRVTELKIF